MRTTIFVILTSAFMAGSMLEGRLNLPKVPKIYLIDAKGKRVDSTHYDSYGNFQFSIKKTGTYQIVKAQGTHVSWSKRAHLSKGLHRLQIPDIEKKQATKESFRTGLSVGRSKSIHSVPESMGDVDSRHCLAPEMLMESLPMATEPVIKSKSVDIPTMKSTAKAGTLTAGIWNDLENWERFEKTLNEDAAASSSWRWNLFKNRYALEISDKNGKTAIDVPVQLRSSGGEIIWQSKTDNRGYAELWSDPFDLKSTSGNMELFAQWGEHSWKSLGKIKSEGSARSSYRINQVLNSPKSVDIAFVVDATGSMGDEINYLKAEMMELMMRCTQFAPCSPIRLGTVFYKDIHDDYVAKHSSFTSRYEDAVAFVQEQFAGGGGDFPEAVDAGLNESIEKLQWSTNALARICFLVLDAPPHLEKKSEIQRLSKEYALKGIKIVPIVASGIDKPTEYLMKQMAAITGGDYLYITDHSGVGNTHLKPSGVDQNMDLLINQMEKVIRKYTHFDDCKEEPKPYQPDPRTVIFGDQQIVIQSFPNPAVSHVNIHSNVQIKDAELWSTNGQLIKRFENIQSDKCRLDVNGISKGMYILHVQAEGKTYKAKILILESQRID